MINVTLPNGSALALDDGATACDCARAIGPGLAKSALAAKINGRPVDLSHPLAGGDRVELLTFDSPEGKAVFWHTASHVLAQAVQELFPEAKLAIGPAIENGFYYDFDVERPFTPEDLEAIEKQCREVARRAEPISREELSLEEARAFFTRKNEPYKLELLDGLEGSPRFYRQGEWQDLCRGPHLPNTKMVKALKVLSSAGAYWRGDENRPMLQRIYAVAFPRQAQLDEHLAFLEEAKKRDHRKLGRELDLFSFHAEGTGFPFWHPRGMVLYNTILDFHRQEHLAAGYKEIRTPIILNEELWHRSGHWDKYRENMYFTTIDEVPHAVKPMNCPGGLVLFGSQPHSYREFPLKICEFGLVHRHELAGVLHGLFRVRSFTQDDAHIFCLPDQIEEQIGEVIAFIIHIYDEFGFRDYEMELSTRPGKYIGSPEDWDRAEAALKQVLEHRGHPYKLNPGDGAFYGPKIDFHIKDCLGRRWQCGTVQLDFSMPERFSLEYTDADGTKKRPVMIHRALLGSMERFVGILLEHYAGALPLWLAPVQVRLIPVADRFGEFAADVEKILAAAGIRAEVDYRSEKVGYKIRDAELQKIPCMAIVGEREEASRSVSLRRHGTGDLGGRSLEELVALLRAEISSKTTA